MGALLRETLLQETPHLGLKDSCRCGKGGCSWEIAGCREKTEKDSYYALALADVVRGCKNWRLCVNLRLKRFPINTP